MPDQAPLVVAAAEDGDGVACEILTWNASELAESVLAVARQLELTRQPFEVVMSGKLFQASDLFRQSFIARVQSGARLADCKLFTTPPVVGAVIMAMHAMQVNVLEIAKARDVLTGIDFKNSTY